jgi:predicted HicB family RNase H-like nuclease
MTNRPQIDPQRVETASEMLRVRVTPTEAKKLRMVATKNKISMSELLRQVIKKVTDAK